VRAAAVPDGRGAKALLNGTCSEQLILILGLSKPLLFAVYADHPQLKEKLIL
jgi:hypothetical protein